MHKENIIHTYNPAKCKLSMTTQSYSKKMFNHPNVLQYHIKINAISKKTHQW